MVKIINPRGKTLCTVDAPVQDVATALSRGGFNLLVSETAIKVLPCSGDTPGGKRWNSQPATPSSPLRRAA